MPQLDFPWERDAINDVPIPDGLPPFELLARLALYGLYAKFQAGKISRDMASARKKQIKCAYDDANNKIAQINAEMKSYANRTLATESARRDFRKAETDEQRLRAATRLINILDGLER